MQDFDAITLLAGFAAGWILFPLVSRESRRDKGITKRDYFAAKAMQGMWASDAPGWYCSGKPEAIAARAKEAYAMADAMLAEREKGGAA